MRVLSYMVAGLAAVASAIPATEVVKQINTLGTLSRNLHSPAQKLIEEDAILYSFRQGNFPIIISGFKEVSDLADEYLAKLTYETYSGNDADIIREAAKNFAKDQNEVQSILNAKGRTFTQYLDVVRAVSWTIGSFASGLYTYSESIVDMMESQKEETAGSFNSVVENIEKTRATWNGDIIEDPEL